MQESHCLKFISLFNLHRLDSADQFHSRACIMLTYICCFVNWLATLTPLVMLFHWWLFDPRNNVIACAKHFVGDGGTHKGLNEGDTILSYEDLGRIHMAPYLDCISQGVGTIMVSYSSWNGRQLHAHHFLLTEVLKDKLGFKVKIASNFYFRIFYL
jgi:hypothetical protein